MSWCHKFSKNIDIAYFWFKFQLSSTGNSTKLICIFLQEFLNSFTWLVRNKMKKKLCEVMCAQYSQSFVNSFVARPKNRTNCKNYSLLTLMKKWHHKKVQRNSNQQGNCLKLHAHWINIIKIAEMLSATQFLELKL